MGTLISAGELEVGDVFRIPDTRWSADIRIVTHARTVTVMETYVVLETDLVDGAPGRRAGILDLRNSITVERLEDTPQDDIAGRLSYMEEGDTFQVWRADGKFWT